MESDFCHFLLGENMESVLDMLKAKQNTANKLFCEKIIPTNLEIFGVSIPE